MDRHMALRLKQHFDASMNPERIRNVRPVKLIFRVGRDKTAEYFGVEYDRADHYLPTERAVTDGGKTAGAEYTTRNYQVLGKRHKIIAANKREYGEYSSKYVWRMTGDDGDWYTSCYYEQNDCNEYYPYGACFQLARWPHENPWHGPIDRYDEKKCERKALTVEYLD